MPVYPHCFVSVGKQQEEWIRQGAAWMGTETQEGFERGGGGPAGTSLGVTTAA